MTTLDFEDFFESSLSFGVSTEAKAKLKKAKKKPTKLKLKKINKPVTKKPLPKPPTKSNVFSKAVKAKQLENKKKLVVAKKAKEKAVETIKRAKVIARIDPVKANILAAKAVTLGKTADKLVQTVKTDVDAQRATPVSSTSTVLKNYISTVKESGKPEAKKELEAVKDNLVAEVAAIAAPLPVEEEKEESLNDTILAKLDTLENQILNEQDSLYRRRVLGKLASLQRRVNSGSIANMGVFA